MLSVGRIESRRLFESPGVCMRWRTAVIEAKGICKAYGPILALEDVSFQVDARMGP